MTRLSVTTGLYTNVLYCNIGDSHEVNQKNSVGCCALSSSMQSNKHNRVKFTVLAKNLWLIDVHKMNRSVGMIKVWRVEDFVNTVIYHTGATTQFT